MNMKHKLKDKRKEVKTENQRSDLWKSPSPFLDFFSQVLGGRRIFWTNLDLRPSKNFKQKNDRTFALFWILGTQHLILPCEPSPRCIWPRVLNKYLVNMNFLLNVKYKNAFVWSIHMYTWVECPRKINFVQTHKISLLIIFNKCQLKSYYLPSYSNVTLISFLNSISGMQI